MFPISKFNNRPLDPNTIELANGDTRATDEQIRRRCPELFGNEFYLEPLRKALEELGKFSYGDPLESSLAQ